MNFQNTKTSCMALCFLFLFMALYLFYGLFGLLNFLIMIKKLVQNKSTVLYIVFILLGFVCIRFFEDLLFYDPLLKYYKQEFQNINLPEMDVFKMGLHFTFRYLLNSILSLLLLWTIFHDKNLIHFSTVLYVILLFLLIIAFYLTLFFYASSAKMVLFYIRRFLIQPIFILLFIPAFWYQKIVTHK